MQPDPVAAFPRLQRRGQLRADLRVARKLVAAAFQPLRPLMAHLIVTRRCNLSCGYCTEYDKVSPPVPLDVLKARVDHLAALGTVFVTLTGGETLLHPQIVELVAHVRARGMTPALNTNGYLLTKEKIVALGLAGLYALQLSLDNVTPSDVTKKSLKPLLPKLRLLARHATFRVRVNTVFGAAPPEEALEAVRTVARFGFDAKCSLARDAQGHPLPQGERARAIYAEIQGLADRGSRLLSEDFQQALLRDGAIEWKCRAGARFFTVCEDGLVHLCTPKWGLGARPLAGYGREDLERAFHAPKSCASTCPVAYAHQGSSLDRWRAQAGAPLVLGDGARPGGKVHLRVVA